MSEESKRNEVELTAKAVLGADGKVSGTVTGRMYSHVKASDETATTVAVSESMTADETRELEKAMAAIVAKHRRRLEDKTFDERSFARAKARRSGEIKE